MSKQCIWCGGVGAENHVEHIIPEALGCPPEFTLSPDVVCKQCNNGLAHLDQAVTQEFDFASFFAGVPRKAGRTPVIASRGNVRGSYVDGKPVVSFNLERYAVLAHDGVRLAPVRSTGRSVRAKFTRQGAYAGLAMSLPFGDSPKFVRGLTKIALSSVAYFLGADVARLSQFDAVRSYVCDGVGVRHALLQSSDRSEYRNTVWAPFSSETGELAVTFRLAQVEFLLDLSPEEALLPRLEAKQRELGGSSGWCVLPLRN